MSKDLYQIKKLLTTKNGTYTCYSLTELQLKLKKQFSGEEEAEPVGQHLFNSNLKRERKKIR